MSLSTKFALFISVLCMIIIAATGFLSYRISYAELEAALGVRLEAIAASGAIAIDSTLHDQIRGPEDDRSEAFHVLRDHLRALKRANSLSEEIYSLRRVGEQLQFVVMTNQRHYIGDSYSIKSEMLPTLNDGQAGHTGVYTDVHGRWISGYGPILDADGQVTGLLEVDIEVDEFLSLLRAKYVHLLWISLGLGLFAVLMSFALARTVTRKLNYLTAVTERISLGKMDTEIQVGGRDEAARLGASLERMRESLKIAAELIG